MKRAFGIMLAFAALVACGGGGATTAAPPTFYAAILPALSPNGASIQLSRGGNGPTTGSLTFSRNNAPAQTTIAVSPLPLPTPKWPLPDQIAGYSVTLNNTVTFDTFPPVMCISGSFSSTRSYVLYVNDSSGRKLAQLPGIVNSTGVCTAATSIAGEMQANEPYSFVMTMSTDP